MAPSRLVQDTFFMELSAAASCNESQIARAGVSGGGGG
jgi:hypothetical protein